MVSIEVVVGLLLFILSFSYALLDISYFFKKETQEYEQLHFLEYGTLYLMGYYQILLKALLALLFVFVFLMVYNMVLVGVFKPLISNPVAPGVSGDATYDEIVAKAKGGYFEIISAIARLIFTTVFEIVDVKFALAVVFVILPVSIFIIAVCYHIIIASKKKMENVEEPVEIRATNYHYITLISLSFIVVAIGFIAFIGFKGCNKN